MKSVIFFDFDGVMVTDRHLMHLADTNSPLRDDYGSVFDPVCVECLRQIIDNTDAGIVVTSTWKMNLGLEGLQQMWQARNLPGKVIGVTPDIDPIHRGNEIQAWLDANPSVVRYAIIDDCPILDFFREDQLPYLFKVDERTGLAEETMKKIIEHFIMTPEKYIEKLKEVQRTLDSVKEDLDRAIDKMQRRIETGYESMEQESRLAALAGREYVKLADSSIYEVATAKIE